MDGENVQQKNAINDETFVYECKGFGNPKPTVTWLKGNTTIESEDDVENPRIIIKNSTDMYNAVIKIKVCACVCVLCPNPAIARGVGLVSEFG